jgi:hypothetical protein
MSVCYTQRVIAVVLLSEAYNDFRRLNTGVVGLNLTSDTNVRASRFVFVLSCVCRGLAIGLSLIQGVLQIVLKIHNFRS